MKTQTHEYNNGLVYNTKHVFRGALNRAQLVNLHEPFQEAIFTDIMLRSYPRVYVNLGCAWGYYSLLAKHLSPGTIVHSVDQSQQCLTHLEESMRLNRIEDIRRHRLYCQQLRDVLNCVGDRPIDFLSMDIEGAEAEICTAPRCELRLISQWLIATHFRRDSRATHEHCIKYLKRAGFKIKFQALQVPLQPDGLIWAERI